MRLKLRNIALLIVALMLTGCATLGQRESSVQLPNGEIVTVRCPHDGKVEFKQGETQIKVDLQGKPGPIDSLVALMSLGFARMFTATEVVK